jgi:hypothetical protein
MRFMIPPLWLVLEIDVGERLTFAVLYDEGLGMLLDLPRQRIVDALLPCRRR